MKGEAAISIGTQAVADELALELTLSRWNAEKLVYTAVGLCLESPDILNALTTGDIDLPKAEIIQDYAHTLITASRNDDPDGADPEQLARDLKDKLLKAAKDKTSSQVKKTAEDELIRVNPAAAERRHATKRTRRHMQLIPDMDSMCYLSVYLPADQGVKIMAALNALAEASWVEGDTRTAQQASVDILYDLVMTALATFGGTDAEHHCCHPDHQHDHTTTHTTGTDADADADADADSGAGSDAGSHSRATNESESEPDLDPEARSSSRPDPSSGRAPSGQSKPPQAEPPSPEPRTPEPSAPPAPNTGQPTAPVRSLRPKATTEVLLTISAETLTGASDDPALLGGYGPIIASMARDVAATGTWRCALTNGTHGTLDGLGTSTYTPNYEPTQRLRRHIIARDTHCRWPGCTRPARRCDHEHVQPYSTGGATCECNNEALCHHHHRLKHETGFTVEFSTNPEHPPGTIVFTSPAGRQRISYPDPLQNPSTAGKPTPSGPDQAAPGYGPHPEPNQHRPKPPARRKPRPDPGPPPF
jgi:hypothetical protein